MGFDFKSLSPEYATLWDTMEIVRDQSAIDKTVRRIIAHKAEYQAIEKLTRVPWFVIGILDMREGGGGCCTHLHNGDKLDKPTVNVPAKRPSGEGPFTWAESAVDALKIKGYDKITDWTIERMAYVFERYNGFGYRQKKIDIPSPYLWGGSNHQQPGKYIRDGVFSKAVLDPQVGSMVLLRRIAELAGVSLVSAHGATANANETSSASNRKAEDPPMSFEKKATIATTIVTGGAAAAKAVTGGGDEKSPPRTVDDHIASAQKRVDQGKQAVAIAKDVGGLIPGVPMHVAIPGAILIAGGALAFWLSRRK